MFTVLLILYSQYIIHIEIICYLHFFINVKSPKPLKEVIINEVSNSTRFGSGPHLKMAVCQCHPPPTFIGPYLQMAD